jgi:glycosyltransferase involved in cell wall biosynthesis
MKLSGPQGEEEPRILVIAGMHRSGTSLLAALASEAGFDMGARLLPAGPGNPGGHFEDLDFVELHDAALAARGAAALAVAPDFSFAPAVAEVEAARELLRERQAKPRWGFKDPRATLFLDFWAERLPEARFLLLYRHPVEVILSLLRRGLDLDAMAEPASALRCWEVYNERALAFRREHPERCEIWDLRALAENPAAACERLAAVARSPLRDAASVFRAQDLRLGLAAPEIDWDGVIPGAMALHRRLGEAADWPVEDGEDAPRAVASVAPLEAAAEHLLATALRREPATEPIPPHLRGWYAELKWVASEREAEVRRLEARAAELDRSLRERDAAAKRLGATRGWQLLSSWWRFAAAVRRLGQRAARAAPALARRLRRGPAAGDLGDLGNLGDLGDLLIGCVTEDAPRSLGQTLRLVRSIRWFGGRAAAARILVCAVESIRPEARAALAALGAEVRVVPRFDARSPFANKLQFFAEAETTGASFLLLLDCDTLLVGDPLPLMPGGVFSAAIADVPSVTHDVFVRLFAHFGLRLPPRRHTTTLLPEPTIAYFNSGVLSVPAPLARDLATAWRDYNRRLLDDPALLAPCERHANQAALALAVAARAIPYQAAPAALNLPIHMPHLARTPELLAAEPVILHYHGRVDADGFLLRTGYPRVDARIDAFNERQRAEGAPLPAAAPRLVAVHHRLAGRSGHRFHEALGLMREAPVRGLAPVVLIHREAEPEVRAALPAARAVLHDPVFRTDLSFAERVRDFAAMLHAHVDRELTARDLVLMTVATQCEAAAFAEWLRALGEPGPRVVLFFHSDRWNRHGEAERRRQLAELRQAAEALAALPPEAAARLRLGAATPGLARELTGLLGRPVAHAPLPIVNGERAAARRANGSGSTPRLGFLGGARPEKGFHETRAILEALRPRLGFRALLQLANEQMPEAAWTDLERLAEDPDVEPLRGALSAEQWEEALASCDLLVLPYDRTAYRQRLSGIFAEGVAAGIPAVVPDGIWMAEQIAAGAAAGVSFSGNEPGAVAAACAEAVSRLPELRARAALLAAPWRRGTGLAAFLDWAEGS